MSKRLAPVLWMLCLGSGSALVACGDASKTASSPADVGSEAGTASTNEVRAKRFSPNRDGYMLVKGASDDGLCSAEVEWWLDTQDAWLMFSCADGGGAGCVTDLRVRLVMQKNGHDGIGTPKVSAFAGDEGSGLWNVRDLAPSMPGDWELHIDAKLKLSGDAVHFVMPLHFPASAMKHVRAPKGFSKA